MKHFTLILSTIGFLLLVVIAALYMQARTAMQQQEILFHQVLAEDAFDHIETQLALFMRDQNTLNHQSFSELIDDKVVAQDSGNVATYFCLTDKQLVGIADDKPLLKQTVLDALQASPADAAAEAGINDIDPVIAQQNSYILQNKQEPVIQQELEQGVYSQRVQTNVVAKSFSLSKYEQGSFSASSNHARTDAPFLLCTAQPDQMVLSRQLDQGKNQAIERQGFVIDMHKLQSQLIQRYEQDSAEQHPVHLEWTYGNHAANSRNINIQPGFIGYYHQLSEPFDQFGLVAHMPIIEDQPGISLHTLNIITLALSLLTVSGLFLLWRTVKVSQRFVERRQNFAAAVSHELKTPLTAIRMHAEMLESGMVDSDARRRDYYHTIHAESERLTRLIDNVLTLSQLEQHNYKAQLMSGDLRTVVSEAIAMLEPHARQHDFTIETDFADALPALRFDRDAVIQIMINAIDNSIKFGRAAEEKRIVVSLQPREQGVHLRIRDFGPGIPVAHQNHIFEAFYRGERELTRSSKGTGIGLALVRQLAAAMQARVDGSNAPDCGFQLDIYFNQRAATN